MRSARTLTLTHTYSPGNNETIDANKINRKHSKQIKRTAKSNAQKSNSEFISIITNLAHKMCHRFLFMSSRAYNLLQFGSHSMQESETVRLGVRVSSFFFIGVCFFGVGFVLFCFVSANFFVQFWH